MVRRSNATTLWLPLENRAGAWVGATAVLSAYCATMSRDMSLYDSPELALAAVQLGLGHPIGQPLHTMLGWIFAHLPGIPSLVGLNFLSALCGALAVLPAVSIGEGLIRNRLAPDGKGALGYRSPELCLVTALCGLHAALWEPATRIEVYPLAAFFALWAAARLAGAMERDAGGPRDFFFAGLSLGLSASANVLIAVAVAAAAAPRLLGLLIRREMPLRNLGAAFVGGMLGLLPYLYVFLVAFRKDVFVWGSPTDFSSALFYFQGRDFRPRSWVTADIGNHAVEWFAWSIKRAMLPLPALGIACHLVLANGHGLGRAFALWAFALTLLQIVTNSVWQLDNPDYLGYLMAPLWLSAAGVGALAAEGRRRGLGYGLAVLTALGCLVVLAPPAIYARTRHLDRVTRIMAQAALQETPRRSIVIVESDHWVFPLLYLQMAEGWRPDVVIAAYGLSSSSWYWELMFRRHPDLRRVALRAPGGRSARVARLLEANPDRPVRLENIRLASELGIGVCRGGWLLRGGESCRTLPPLDPGPTRALDRALKAVGAGSPGADQMIAAVSFNRGEALLRFGRFDAAFDAFIAGVPSPMRPAGAAPAQLKVSDPSGLRSYRLPVWRKPAALGDPGRNLYLAGVILRFAGDIPAALSYMIAAAAAGLPEAEQEVKILDVGNYTK